MTQTKVTSDLITSVDASKLTGSLPASMATDTSNLESRLKTSELRIAGLNDAGINNSEGSFADAYTNETGVDTGASTNESYDATNNVYLNAGAQTEVDYAGSSNIGDMTTGGGLVAAFDGTTSQADHLSARKLSATTGFVGKQLASAATITGVKLWGATNAAYSTNTFSIYIYGSNSAPSNSTDGTIIATVATSQSPTGNTDAREKLSGFVTTTAYDHVWVTVTQTSSGQIQIAEVEFYETAPAVNMTLISNTVTAETEPTTVEVLLVNEPVDTVTINTDLTMEVSIDGGSTYDAVTLVDKGLFATGQNLLRGSADVTARTGTSIKYRLKTLNTKSQKQVGVVLAWS